ncbi:MAG: hypothetical protein ACK55Y_08520, partial [Pseudanabaena sp.]
TIKHINPVPHTTTYLHILNQNTECWDRPHRGRNKLSVLVLIKLSYLSPYTKSLLSSAKANNNAKNISTKPN